MSRGGMLPTHNCDEVSDIAPALLRMSVAALVGGSGRRARGRCAALAALVCARRTYAHTQGVLRDTQWKTGDDVCEYVLLRMGVS